MIIRRGAFSLIELLTASGDRGGAGGTRHRREPPDPGRREKGRLPRPAALCRGKPCSTHAGEHNAQLTGPLWPGQVMLYDARAGRPRSSAISRAYLGIEHRDSPYVVDRMIPKAFQPNPTAAPLADSARLRDELLDRPGWPDEPALRLAHGQSHRGIDAPRAAGKSTGLRTLDDQRNRSTAAPRCERRSLESEHATEARARWVSCFGEF